MNLHRKLIGEVPIVYSDPTSAILVSTLISAAVSNKQSMDTRQAASKAKSERDEASRLAQEEADRIARDTRPEGEGVESIEFGTGDDSEVGSVSDFVVARKNSGLGSDTSSGLGFRI